MDHPQTPHRPANEPDPREVPRPDPRRVEVSGPEGVRFVPAETSGVGVLVLAGSSGRVDEDRALLLARHGVVAESVRWFGGPGQPSGPFEVPLETVLERVASLRRECDRVVLVGTSFGAEAVLLAGAHGDRVDAVAAFAPSDVVWAGVTPEGRVTSHWTLAGEPLPFVPFAEDWRPTSDPPAFRDLYLASRATHADRLPAARIPVERIPRVLTVAGGDDRVWPAALHARLIAERRAEHGLPTVQVLDGAAGHRAVLPGEARPTAGVAMARGGTPEADRRLGALAWPALLALVDGTEAP